MREVLVDWLFELNENFGHGPETLYRATQVLDQYLYVLATATSTLIARDKFQLVGTCAYSVSCKFNEIRTPLSTKDSVTICAGQYTEEEVSDAKKRDDRFIISLGVRCVSDFDIDLSNCNFILFGGTESVDVFTNTHAHAHAHAHTQYVWLDYVLFF